MKQRASAFTDIMKLPVFGTSVAAFLLGLLVLLFTEDLIPAWILGVVVSVSLFVIWYLSIILYNEKINNNRIIDVSQFHYIQGIPQQIIIHKNDLLRHGAYLTIYFRDNEYDQYTATGVVSNVQDNGLIIADIVHKSEDEGHTPISNDISFLRKLIIKPIVTDNYIKED